MTATLALPGARPDERTGALVVGVVGARGGVGASTFAALLARRLSVRTSTVLVDLVVGTGIEVLLGLEDRPGARWPDLAGVTADVAGEQVLDLLPRWGACAALSADRARPAPADGPVVDAVLGVLAQVCGAIVLDLDRAAVLGGRAPTGLCDLMVLVTPRDVVGLAGAVALRDALGPAALRAGLAVRGPAPGRLGVGELADAVGLPVLCRSPRDRAAAGLAERGEVPRRGPAARAAAHVVRTCLTSPSW